MTTFGHDADLSRASFGHSADARWATFGDRADLSGTRFGEAARLVDTWFAGDVRFVGAVFAGQQRTVGPLYAGGTVDLHDAHFGADTRLEIDSGRVVLSRGVFGGSAEIRVLRALIEASETTFASRATIAALDRARRPDTQIFGRPRTDHEGSELRHATADDASMWSLRRTDVAQLTIAGVLVNQARFAGAQNLESLRLIDTRFDEHGGRQRVREETLLDLPDTEPTADERRMGHPPCTAEQVAEIYRSLRKGREDSADAPGGNDLYVGEQRMRRRALKEKPRSRARRCLLWLYENIGGYGVVPGRPFMWLLVVLVTAWGLALVDLCPGSAALFVARSALLLPNAIPISSTLGDWLQLVLRVVAPPLIALTVLGVRAQIKR